MSALKKATILASVATSPLAKRRMLRDLGVPKSTYRGRKAHGPVRIFSRSVLQSMTRAAMDSTTAGSGDELVATETTPRPTWMW